MNKVQKINLQFFANVSDIMTQHPDAFPEGNDFGTRFGDVQTQLQALGYDVLINNRASAEFIPASRLSEVISQRDGLKAQLDKATRDLEAIKTQENIPEDAQRQIDSLIQTNQALVDSLKEANIRLGIVTEFDDAIDASDIIQFIDKSKLKIDKDGKITSGLTEEHERLKGEKPYLFVATQTETKKAGQDPGNNGGGSEKATMNSLIRRAAYGSSKI